MSLFEITSLGRPARELLANMDAWKNMGDRFSGDHLTLQTEDVVGFGVIIFLFAAGYFVLQWFAMRQKNGQKHSPKELFRELCEAHGLERQERKLLIRIADELELSDRTGLFIRPDLYERAPVLEAIGKEPCQQMKSRLFE